MKRLLIGATVRRKSSKHSRAKGPRRTSRCGIDAAAEILGRRLDWSTSGSTTAFAAPRENTFIQVLVIIGTAHGTPHRQDSAEIVRWLRRVRLRIDRMHHTRGSCYGLLIKTSLTKCRFK